STLFIFTLSLILGYNFSSYTEASIVFSDLQYIGGYFLKLVAFFSFCLFAGILVKRSAFSIGFIFVWFIVESIIRGFLHLKFFKDDQVLATKIAGFLPLDAMANLIKEPFSRFEAYRAIENQVSGTREIKFYGIHWYEVVIVLCWTAIFIFLSYRILKRRDL